MADKIIRGSKCVEADDTICQWEFSYEVESSGKLNSFCVVIKAEEMTDPTSESEAKTKANLKAKDIKDAWVATLVDASTNTAVVSVEESVTL